MKYPDFLGAIGGIMLFVGVLNPFHLELSRFALILLGLPVFFSSMLALCPRCRVNISQNPTIWKHSMVETPRYCFQCGRDRKGVWPLQFIFRPEPWDGEYHDEGGGPKPKIEGLDE